MKKNWLAPDDHFNHSWTAMLFRKLFQLVVFCILPLTLSQCVLSNTDAGFGALEQTAELNPSPRAIQGMWYRRDTRMTTEDSTTSLLFHPDGTVLAKGKMVMLGMVKDGPLERKRYTYVGRGVWRITGTNATLKLSQGKLLFYYPIPQYYDEIRFVFERDS